VQAGTSTRRSSRQAELSWFRSSDGSSPTGPAPLRRSPDNQGRSFPLGNELAPPPPLTAPLQGPNDLAPPEAKQHAAKVQLTDHFHCNTADVVCGRSRHLRTTAAHQAASLIATRPSSAAFASLVMRRTISPAGRISSMLPALYPAVRHACSMSPSKSRVGRMAL
jgi:hypothetical protein